jgi:hypothetical protein
VGFGRVNIKGDTENVSAAVIESGTENRVIEFRVVYPSVWNHQDTMIIRII